MKTKIVFFFIYCLSHCFIMAKDMVSLTFEYQNDGINICSTDKSFTLRIENTYERMYQISKEKTKMIVFTESESEEPYYNSIYYIN